MKQSDRGFGLSFAGLFAVLAAIGWLIFDALWYWAGALAIIFLICALACSWVLLPLNRLWQRFAHAIGLFNNHLVLGVFFYLVMVPVSAVMRLLGRDPMQRRARTDEASYWSSVSRTTTATTLHDPF